MTTFRVHPTRPGYCIEMIRLDGTSAIVWKSETEAEALMLVRELEQIFAVRRNPGRRLASLFRRQRMA
jgi:hypothetical protein